MTKVVSKGGKDWDEVLGPNLLAYRSPHSSTGESPFTVLYGSPLLLCHIGPSVVSDF